MSSVPYRLDLLDRNARNMSADLASTASGKGAALIGDSGGTTAQAALDQSRQATAIGISDTWLPGATAAKFARTIKVAANHQTLPEIGHYVEMTQTVAPTGTLGTVYKIGWGGVVKSTVTQSDLYGMNPVVDGNAGPGFGILYGVEADVNNRGADADTVSSANAAYGFLAASGGTKRATAAFASAGYFDAPKWANGFAAWGYTKDATFYDSTNATTCLDIRGAHTYGVDTRNAAALSYAMMLKNDLPVSGVKSDGTTVVNLVKVNASNLLELGDTGVGYIQVNQALVPKTDNTYSLGTGSLRWGQIYSGSGTISTSDPTLKKDMTPLSSDVATALLGSINPISYRFKAGGADVETIEEDGEVEETYLAEDGEDDKGNPVLVFKTRMVPGRVKRDIVTPREGKRLHFGFDASEVKQALAALGIDGALYVRDEDTDMLRMEQFTPILWVLVKDLAARVAVLEGRA